MRSSPCGKQPVTWAPDICLPRRFEQTAEASAARKLKMTEALAKRVKKKREDRLALWADDGDHDDDDEACASHKLAVVLEEVKGRGADFRHLREVRLVDCLITDEKLAVLVAALGQGCVSVLALGGNQITNIGARTLGDARAALAPLRELHLNGNNIADPGIEFLCKHLYTIPKQRLCLFIIKKLYHSNMGRLHAFWCHSSRNL